MKNNIMTITASIAAICLLSACGSSENTANDTTTTTTTTTVTTTAEPETTTETTTTTEATTTTAEPETSAETDTDTDTKATTTETPADETTVNNDDGKYTVAECFKMKAEEATGKKVVEFDYYTDDIPYVAIFEDGSKSVLMMPKEWDSSTVSIDNFEADKDAMEGVECVVTYNP